MLSVGREASVGEDCLESVDGSDDGKGEDRGAPEKGWEFFHGARSLATTLLAGIVVLVFELLQGEGPHYRQFGLVLVTYASGMFAGFLALRWLFRREEAVLPPDRHGDGRFALIFGALALFTLGDAEDARSAVWLAVGAVGLGGAADGSWIAIVGKRNGLGFWRGWRALLFREKEARKWCWQSLFGEGRR